MSTLTQQSSASAGDLEQSTVRKTIMMLVPLMVAMYVIAYIDRQNISFAKLQMIGSLGWSESAFGLGSSLFFIGYLVFSVPGNLILSKVGAKRWFALSLCAWGVITISLAFTQSLTMFYLLRFILGLAEASFYPGLIYYSTQWFPTKYRPRIVGFLVMASMFANMIGAPLNGGLLSLHGFMGYEGWQWLFFVTGLLALILIVPVLYFFPGTPEHSTFLAPAQKAWLLKRLDEERRQQTDQSVNTLFKSLTDKRVLALALVYGFICFGAYGISYWMPTIVKSFGVSDMKNGLVNMIPWALVMILLRWLTKNPERTNNPFINVALPMFTASLCLIGSVWFYAVPVVSFAFICGVVLSVFAIQPCFWNMTKFLSGASAAAGLAIINSLANLGGFFAQNTIPLVRDEMQSASAPMIYLSIVMLVGGICTVLIIKWLQRKGETVVAAPVAGH
ncbi:MFS transporter [Rouxiella chamberiensis]|uniref:MFS transporter n=1 Tax=Rouxiella chamberiensis TaxID=1513468 RepID=UPI0005D34BD7|nr:MFS transporter [Rouxiella chamberiensis]